MNQNKILDRIPKKNSEPKIEYLKEDDKIIITYPKKFGKIEKWVHDRIGGPKLIKRPLDKYTSLIWELCDGKNTIGKIIEEFDNQFGEEVAPADKRVQIFLRKLLELNLITLN